MTVKELIEKLSGYPEELEVVIEDEYRGPSETDYVHKGYYFWDKKDGVGKFHYEDKLGENETPNAVLIS